MFDALVVDDVGVEVQSRGVNGRDANIGVPLEHVDDVFHLRIDVARLVENLVEKKARLKNSHQKILTSI